MRLCNYFYKQNLKLYACMFEKLYSNNNIFFPIDVYNKVYCDENETRLIDLTRKIRIN